MHVVDYHSFPYAASIYRGDKPGGIYCRYQFYPRGRYMLVDHALTRVERGLVGFLIFEGAANPEIHLPGAP